jgi:hypothetical protein
MAEGSMTVSRLLFALMLSAALPSLALAQDAGQDQGQDGDQAQPDQAQPDQSQSDQDQSGQQPAPEQQDQANAPAPADPVATLQGLWHVDHAEGSAANDTMTGSILKIDRQAIASLSGGTCSSPSFSPGTDAADPKQMAVDITCLGQAFASAHWNSDDPNTVDWSEPGLDITLHRVTSAAQQPADDNAGAGDAQ